MWKTLWKLCITSQVIVAGLSAQQPPFYRLSPDCMIFFNQTATGASSTFDNRNVGCVNWAVSYMATGFSALTLVFQVAQDNSGVPDTFGTFGGTVTIGSASMTSTTSTFSTYIGYAPWVRTNVTAVTGAGRITGVMYGYRIGWGGGTSGSGGGGGTSDVNVIQWGSSATTLGQKAMTASVPVVVASDQSNVPVSQATASALNAQVVGPAASGAALAGNPVRVGISDGTNAQNALSASVVGDGSTGVGIPAQSPSRFNGSTWDRDFVCASQAVVSLSAATEAVIIASPGATITRICHISLATDTSADITIRQGTGTTCQTNTAVLAGPYQDSVAIALDFTPQSALRTTVASRDVCLLFSASVTGAGVVIYGSY